VSLRHVFTYTSQLSDVTLFKRGRTFSGVTVDIDKFTDPGDTTVLKPSGTDLSGSELFVVTRTEGLAQIYHNDARTIAEAWNSANVINGATLEFYKTVTPDAFGQYSNYQGEFRAVDDKIVRRVYFNGRSRLATDTDSGWSVVQTMADNSTLAETIDYLQTYVGTDTGDTFQYTAVISHEFVSTADTLLDQYAGATAAYSLRKLRNAYSGDCIIVRRDGASPGSQAIGFNASGELDTTSIISFCGSNNGFVTRWYDQVGSNDLVQTSTTAQPKIYNGSSIEQLNSKPAMLLDGSNDSLVTSGNVNLNDNQNELIAAWVGSVTNLDSGNNMVSHWNSTTGNQVFQIQLTGSNDNLRFLARYANGSAGTVNSGSAITSGAQYIVVGRAVNGSATADFDGNTATGNVVSALVNETTSSLLRVGSRSDNQAGPHEGKTQEVVVWSRATAENDRSDISDAINTFYSSY
jgi:hypothetical protein